jgi:hypothetical protein
MCIRVWSWEQSLLIGTDGWAWLFSPLLASDTVAIQSDHVSTRMQMCPTWKVICFALWRYLVVCEIVEGWAVFLDD